MPVRVACEPRRTLLVSRPRSSSASSRPIPPALSRPRPVRCRRPLPPRRRRRTASGRCRRRTTPSRATASLPRSTPTTSASCRSPSPSRPASTAARRRRRSSSATRCTSSRPIPNILYALDLTKAGAPLKWKYEPKPEAAAQGVACCDVVNRGAVFCGRQDLLQHARRQHGRGRRRDRQGALEDQARRHQHRRDDDDGAARRQGQGAGRQLAAANSACAAGSRRSTPTPARSPGRAYSTGPDKDVLIGPEFKPFYDSDQGKDLGVTTWPPDAWKSGGGTVWGWISYDPDAQPDLLRHRQPGPVEPGPAPGRQQVDRRHLRARPRHRRGALVLPVEPARPVRLRRRQREHPARHASGTGSRARCSSAPSATATSTCIDRATGEVLSADALRHDQRDLRRRPQDRPAAIRRSREEAADWTRSCATSARPRPAPRTGNPSAFSPRTGLLYIPHDNLCMDSRRSRRTTSPARPMSAPRSRCTPGPGGHRGEFTPGTSRQAQVGVDDQARTSRSGAARSPPPATSSSTERWTAGSRRSTPRTGELLWQFKTGSGIIGQPITYRGPGRQAVRRDPVRRRRLGGRDRRRRPRLARRHRGARLRQRDDATCRRHTTKGGTLYVFAPAVSAGARCVAAGRRCARLQRRMRAAARDAARLRRSRTTCRSRTRRARASRTGSSSCIAAGPRRDRRLHLVGAAARLRPQHAEGRAVRPRARHAERASKLLRTTRPYYRSTYVFVTRADAARRRRRSTIPRLRELTVGVQLIGDDGANTPPAHALARRGIVEQRARLLDLRRLRQAEPAGPHRRGGGDGRDRRRGGLGTARRVLRAAPNGAAAGRAGDAAGRRAAPADDLRHRDGRAPRGRGFPAGDRRDPRPPQT